MRCLAILLLSGATAALAAPPALQIGVETIVAADIADARAYPQPDGDSAMLVTLEPWALAKLRAVLDQPVNLNADGAACPTIAYTETPDGTLLLPCFKGLTGEQVAAVAKALSGKDPLPETLDDEL